ncbi:LAGLIDADG family homing endonuclease [Candidatus Peregrinibacteria bacterium]|nr:LAGLIDADG family homing endonuclease [Candidatus Peregrinibacteria bacterium]
MQNLNPDYIVGLVDGEGSFTVYVRNLDSKSVVNRRVRFEPRFYLKLIAYDRDILYQLKRFFGCGNIYFQKDTRPNHQNCYRYEVFNRRNLLDVIIPFFKDHPLQLSSKRKDFEIFCELLERMQHGEHLHDEGLRQLLSLKQRMH